ncbi:MAG TPA: cytochrome c [Gammaproteobacteria bacterium]|nr:cytochrome c [Gammaproteobacteria bacterium]
MKRAVVVLVLAGGFAWGLVFAQQGGQGGQAEQSAQGGQAEQSAQGGQAEQRAQSRPNEPVGPAGQNQLARGKAVFEKWCYPCHGDGPGKPGTAALQALYEGQKPALLEERTDLTPQVVKTFVRSGVTVMPFFRKTEIGDADLDALAAYLAQ